MFNWFGRKSAPATAAPWPAWAADSKEPFARSFPAQVNEVYRTNPVGLRCVRLVASMVGGLPVEATEDATARLVLRDDLLERVAADLLLHGNAFVQLAADDRDRPAALLRLRPDRCRIESDGDGRPTGIAYRAAGRSVTLPMQDALYRRSVAHVRGLHPGDDHYGLGCLDAAIGAASVHNRATAWNKGLLDNAARPSGAMTYDPGDGANLSVEQFDRLRRELDEQFSGGGNAGRPMLLDGGLKWQSLSLTPADMDFVALKESAARDIALAFGVPPVLVGLPGDATYANAREAGRALYRQTVLPLAGQILRALDTLLGDWMEPPGLGIDVDRISELAEDRSYLWEQVGRADFLTREEKRVQLGFDGEDAA